MTEDAFEGSASEVIFFKNKPVLKEVMQTVEAMANRIYGLRQKRKHTGNENGAIVAVDNQPSS